MLKKAIKEYEAIYSHVGCHIRSQMEWHTVYELSKDSAFVKKMQKASLAELGLLDPMEIEGTSHGGIEYRFPPTKS